MQLKRRTSKIQYFNCISNFCGDLNNFSLEGEISFPEEIPWKGVVVVHNNWIVSMVAKEYRYVATSSNLTK